MMSRKSCKDGRVIMEHPGKIRRLVTLPAGMEELRSEAAADGFRFMDKLQSDWEAGRNRFDGPGETFLGAFSGPRLLAVGGLNLDPYTTEPHTGRLRHVYVLKSARRQGIATALVRHLLNDARRSFRSVRLCTDTASGAMFYESLGFVRSSSSTASHAFADPRYGVRRAWGNDGMPKPHAHRTGAEHDVDDGGGKKNGAGDRL